MKNWPKMGRKVAKYWQNSGLKWTQNGPKMNPKIVSENLIPAHFESFFWGLYLANFGPLVAREGLFGNQKCKKFLSHSSIQRWEVEDGFGEKLLGCAQLVTKVPRTQSPAHMELTQRSWSCVSQIWAIWEKKFLLQQSWMPCPNFD